MALRTAMSTRVRFYDFNARGENFTAAVELRQTDSNDWSLSIKLETCIYASTRKNAQMERANEMQFRQKSTCGTLKKLLFFLADAFIRRPIHYARDLRIPSVAEIMSPLPLAYSICLMYAGSIS